MTVRGGHDDPRFSFVANGFARILQQVYDDLQQRVAVDLRGRERGIEAFLDRYTARETGECEPAGMTEQRIDVLAGERQ
ncbi:hypothetical protein, partial [Klebsiella pneumoniae]|uniref:hypothetical protein n=1 Tax=Klebsiella pneumoniae TaxID=573 RepID=UPI00376ED72E